MFHLIFLLFKMLTEICQLTFLSDPPSLTDNMLATFAKLFLPYSASASMWTTHYNFLMIKQIKQYPYLMTRNFIYKIYKRLSSLAVFSLHFHLFLLLKCFIFCLRKKSFFFIRVCCIIQSHEDWLGHGHVTFTHRMAWLSSFFQNSRFSAVVSLYARADSSFSSWNMERKSEKEKINRGERTET